MRLELTLQEADHLRAWLVDMGGDPILRDILAKLEQEQAQSTELVRCPVCGHIFTRETVGRSGTYCSAACKQKAYRQRRNEWRKHPGPTC